MDPSLKCGKETSEKASANMHWTQLLGVIETLVLVTLLGLSVWSVTVIIDRRRFLKAYLSDESVAELRGVIKGGKPGASALLKSKAICAALEAAKDSRMSDTKKMRLIKEQLVEFKLETEKGLAVLATLGANAPFIGLFGTVLGVVRAFSKLGEASSSGTASVMTAISMALIATAAGLFVAIPAVAAYNVFAKKIRVALLQIQTSLEAGID
ncbi:MAG: MotA/TolQ/ExbB proton channel family protein [Bdellovibrionales bacterium CG10_big_fil_rev_8_21_14_0_10_45_34]|nr:MAG: MotA/TolQ/ExbB proton channel family protein [Bdellovibrionales bacterium CG10_big_fil_rev_8_21_14_0_10_45_34]